MLGSDASSQKAVEALWQRYRSKNRRLFSTGFFRELALRKHFDVEPLDPRRVAREIPQGAVPDCPNCPNVCCGGYENVVSLRLVDLAVLIDLGRTDLVSKKKPRFPPEVLEIRPNLRDLMASTLWRTLPVLKQEVLDRRCAALTSALRCELYPHWPTSCERFPYTLSTDRRTIRWGTRCPVRKARPEPARGRALVAATIDGYDRRIQDAVLIAHARPDLDRLGLGAWLTGPDEDPFEADPPPRSGWSLPVVG